MHEKHRLLDALPSYSKVVLDRQGRLVDAFLTPDDKWRMEARLDEVGRKFEDALLCLEDRRFYFHPGVDPISLVRAVKQNLTHGRVVSGASTLSMQLAKMLYRRPRDLGSKLLEARDALLLELFFTKKQILKMYLSLTPYGGNVEGVEAASLLYLQKPIKDILVSEMATLLLIPQMPSRLRNFSETQWKSARNRNLDRFLNCGFLSSAEWSVERQRPVKVPKKSRRPVARHISQYLQSKEGPYVETTINLDLQIAIENIISKQRHSFDKQKMNDVAALVIDNESGEVLTAIGNHPDGHKTAAINSLFTFRSPGSTLKPVLYSLGLESGLFLPGSLLQDVPIAIGGYEPENYDRRYRGFVEARTALSQSLNVPFVILLKKIGMERFFYELESLQIKIKEDKNKLGLSAAVGSISLRPWDLAKIYLAFANKGRAVEPTFKRSTTPNTTQWRSRGSTLMTSAALALKKRGSYIPSRFKLYSENPIHWKTGTSQGRKDAWAVGYNKEFTTLVWLGNLDMTSSANLVGADAAGPRFFEIFYLLDRRVKSLAVNDFNTSHLEEVKVCQFSGLLPGSYCPISHRNQLVDQPLKARCRYHQNFELEVSTGQVVYPGCREQLKTIKKTFLVLPAKVKQWIRHRDRYPTTIPSLHPNCEERLPRALNAVQITSPRNGETFYLPSSDVKNAKLRIPIKWSATIPKGRQMDCQLNGVKVGAEVTEQAFIEVKPGAYQLFCSDRHAFAVQSSFSVQRF
ncbi:penicillin-binding protein 1C [Oligoflexaceae bacterium]|nr:penicillin-binding protein 1C [Oligoflexaceae bacterium]